MTPITSTTCTFRRSEEKPLPLRHSMTSIDPKFIVATNMKFETSLRSDMAAGGHNSTHIPVAALAQARTIVLLERHENELDPADCPKNQAARRCLQLNQAVIRQIYDRNRKDVILLEDDCASKTVNRGQIPDPDFQNPDIITKGWVDHPSSILWRKTWERMNPLFEAMDVVRQEVKTAATQVTSADPYILLTKFAEERGEATKARAILYCPWEIIDQQVVFVDYFSAEDFLKCKERFLMECRAAIEEVLFEVVDSTARVRQEGLKKRVSQCLDLPLTPRVVADRISRIFDRRRSERPESHKVFVLAGRAHADASPADPSEAEKLFRYQQACVQMSADFIRHLEARREPYVIINFMRVLSTSTEWLHIA